MPKILIGQVVFEIYDILHLIAQTALLLFNVLTKYNVFRHQQFAFANKLGHSDLKESNILGLNVKKAELSTLKNSPKSEKLQLNRVTKLKIILLLMSF